MRTLNTTTLMAMFCAGTALAETPLTGAEFDAYTKGKTLTFLEQGQSYGAEEYRPGRKVVWAFSNGECTDGEWFEPEVGLICFVYKNSVEGPQCWNFFLTDKGLRAKFNMDSDSTELYEARRSREPLLCLGPEVGV